MTTVPHITVCICTYRRADWLRRLLQALLEQQTDGLFTFSIVVADNDAEESAHPVVAEFTAPSLPTAESGSRTTASATPLSAASEQISAFQRFSVSAFPQGPQIPVAYTVQPVKNIALVRNTALGAATGDYIAFLDDDEFPVKDWLLHLYRTCEKHQVAGVLAPVLPHFDDTAPIWVIKGRFYDRPRHETGFVMPWQECRTGNVLFRRSILSGGEPAFREEFGTGGEDQDFFHRMIDRGHKFIWCDEAIAYETVPPNRWSRKVMLSRALLRGKNSLRHRKGRLKNLLKSLIAVPAYGLALPFLLVVGHHLFMRYLVKLTDHIGRLLALAGMNPIVDRQM